MPPVVVPDYRTRLGDLFVSLAVMVEAMRAANGLADLVEFGEREREREESVRAVPRWETAIVQLGRLIPVEGDEPVGEEGLR